MQIKRAQTFIEYLLVISAVTAIMIAMSTVLRRSVQGMVKAVADQIGAQINSDQQNGIAGGRIDLMDTTMQMDRQTRVKDREGNITYIYTKDSAAMQTFMAVNAGYTEEN